MRGARAAVAAANPQAAEAARSILAAGGSAVDAAVAAQAALTVVEPNASGIGGGAMLLVCADGEVTAIDGVSAAPAEVPSRLETDFDGRSVPMDRAAFGGRTVGVPGALRALELAHRRFGRLPWEAVFAPAIELAAEGFALAPYVVRTLFEIPVMRDEAMAAALYCDGGAPRAVGSVVRNPALAASLSAIAAGGADAFYHGDIGEAIIRAVRGDAFAGRMTMADLASYAAIERQAPRFRLGDWRVATAPLPAYGGIAAGQLIGIAARHGITGIGTDLGEEEIHLLAEAGRVAFADREHFADPDHAVGDGRGVDVGTLLSPEYLARRARHVDRVRRNDRIPAGHADGLGASMTSHVAIADGAGQVVSMTTTINQNFGARIAVGGFYLNNALTNFAVQPLSHGRRVANAMAPGKRPRTSIAPCIVMDGDRPIAAVGAGGGFRIIGNVANALLRLAGGMRDPAAILAAPHAMNWSGTTELEPAFARHVPGLVGRGHFVVVRRFDGGTQMVLADGAGWRAGGDPRRDGVGVVVE